MYNFNTLDGICRARFTIVASNVEQKLAILFLFILAALQSKLPEFMVICS